MSQSSLKVMLADLSVRVVDKVVDQAADKVAGEEIEDSKILRAKVMMMTMMIEMAMGQDQEETSDL